MALVVGTLSSGLSAAWAGYPPSPADAASAWAGAYDAYASAAASCSGGSPSLVMLADLSSGLEAAFTSMGSYSDLAQQIADAHEAYWTGGLFGPGSVVSIGGTSALKSGLEALWESQALTAPAGVPFPASAAAHAALLDVFTKTVEVTDSSIPCGPAPIS
jgi:hypothetical protein